MNPSMTYESQRSAEVNIKINRQHDEQTTQQQADRFARRLNKYRIHQSDCRTRNDQSFHEFCEQEKDNIKKLQDQTKPMSTKQKRVYKRNFKKKDILLPSVPQQFEHPQQQLQFQNTQLNQQSDIQSDFTDLNYKEMLALMNEQTKLFNDLSPSMPSSLEHQQCTCTPSDFLNAYNPSSSFNNFY